MNTVYRCWGIAVALLLSAVLCLTGCTSGGHIDLFGYTTRPPFDESIRTIYVPIALNTTYRQGIEFDLTRAVVREIGANSPYRVTSNRNHADTELLMKIVNVRKTVLLQNQLGETRDAELGMTIEVVWKDLRPGKGGDILSNPKRFDPNELPLPGEPRPQAPKEVPILVTPTATYIPELGGSRTSAEKLEVDRAAARIVNMMEVWR
jgi:hypothetical protein